MKNNNIFSDLQCSPFEIGREFAAAVKRKNAIWKKDFKYQTELNRRFYSGDQWQGANCGKDRPLVQYNVIRRIGEYKQAVINGKAKNMRFFAGATNAEADENEAVLSQFEERYRTAAKRIGIDKISAKILQDAYVSGTGVAFIWWDQDVKSATTFGDVQCEVLDVDNVYFGDVNIEDLQKQPYILAVQKKSTADILKEARAFGAGEYDLACIDGGARNSLDMSFFDEVGERCNIVITKFWKEKNPDSGAEDVWAVRVCGGGVVRPAWRVGISRYPFVKFCWSNNWGRAYGESEITDLIKNQIAINRLMSANIWGAMTNGMPMLMVNGDVVNQRITNEPGQIIEVFGPASETRDAVRYIAPPELSPDFKWSIESLVENTMRMSGVNDVLLGDVRPNNSAAMEIAKQSSLVPLNYLKRDVCRLFEDIAMIFAEFWSSFGGEYAKFALIAEATEVE